MPSALIFGASRGLGRALVQEHLKRGWHVIATVRDGSAFHDLASDSLTVEILDTTDWVAVDALRERLGSRPIDLLFVNAAIAGPSTMPIGEVAAADFIEMMLVNVLAPLRIADRYADLVAADGTIAVMSSSLGSIALNDNAGWEAYRTSKAALDMGLRSIAGRRRDKRTWLAVDPGWVRTDMGGPNATLTIDQSIPSLADMLENRRGSGGVAFVNYKNDEHPW
ncbi:MAG: SDR family NAD(P)-dependent oxidoreductase [Pseudomonadota bacterium]|nr:SDR family NAD(P)-dependent oxidoreductase [Pseudomonadota bacterium]